MMDVEGMNIMTIIPARGSSNRIPCKNMRLLSGKPLIAQTLEQALNATLITHTVVSTDDEEIVAVSEDFGAEVIRRPSVLATDTATSESALKHVLGYLNETEG